MDAVIITVVVVAFLGLLIAFILQKRENKRLRINYRFAVKEVGTCNAKLRFYREQTEEVLQNFSVEELSSLREKVVDERKDTECCKPSSQRTGKLVVCREITDIIDGILIKKAKD